MHNDNLYLFFSAKTTFSFSLGRSSVRGGVSTLALSLVLIPFSSFPPYSFAERITSARRGMRQHTHSRHFVVARGGNVPSKFVLPKNFLVTELKRGKQKRKTFSKRLFGSVKTEKMEILRLTGLKGI